jgi:hypothetical protein
VSDYVLIYHGGAMPEGEEAQKAVMDAWDAWFASIGGALKDGGNPFTGASKSIGADGAVSDGGGGDASGYTILSADSLDEAVNLAKGCPVLQGGASLTVHETFAVM